jgi:hypothetical protein
MDARRTKLKAKLGLAAGSWQLEAGSSSDVEPATSELTRTDAERDAETGDSELALTAESWNAGMRDTDNWKREESGKLAAGSWQLAAESWQLILKSHKRM